MYSLQAISHSFGDHLVLDDISLSLTRGDIAALIGKNGSGKTTLLRIAAGELTPDQGSLVDNDERVGYLPQQFVVTDGSVADFFAEYLPNDVHQVLMKVRMIELPGAQTLATLSGGQKTKLGLARLLLERPTVLVLDEPTNNLDQQGLEWLVWFMRSFSGTILVTSHDRAFLDDVSTRTLELKQGKLAVYGGNYSFARTQQQHEREAHRAKFDAQNAYKLRLEEDIATTKSQAEGVERTVKDVTIRRYAKKVARKAIVREARLEREMGAVAWLDKPYEETLPYLPLPETSIPAGKKVLEITHLHKEFDGRVVIGDLSFQITGNERVQLSGSNGSGKSTILNLVRGLITPDSGTVEIGPGIRVGYVSQEMDAFDTAHTGKQALVATNEHPTRCMHYARALGLQIKDLDNAISALSRGQYTKLAFARMLLARPQLLILDEPTNHIELEAREAIESALQDFQGAILVASHDRYFIERLGIDMEVVLK